MNDHLPLAIANLDSTKRLYYTNHSHHVSLFGLAGWTIVTLYKFISSLFTFNIMWILSIAISIFTTIVTLIVSSL